MAQGKNSSKLEELQEALLNDGDFLKHIVQGFCQKLLEEEMLEHLQADKYQRTEKRCGYRNGYKPRKLKTRVGTLELLVPQDREGRFRTQLFARYQRSEKALVSTLMQMYIEGVSTRKVKYITEKLCGTSFSRSHISELTKNLDREITAWRNRPLEKKYPYLIVDALYEKIRMHHKVTSQAVLIIIGVGEDGYREILGVEIANTETKESWERVFRNLKRRGLKGVKLVVSDDHEGLRQAVERYFQGASWQRCQFHFQHSLLDCVRRNDREKLSEEVKSIFNSPDRYFALSRTKEVVEKYQDIYPKFIQKLEEGIEDALACFHFPAAHRRKIRTTNNLERFNEEIRRRTRVIRIFPNEDACLRLICAICIEQNEEWLTGKRYMRMEPLYEGENEILKVEPEKEVMEVT
jgi:transposase-like protein